MKKALALLLSLSFLTLTAFAAAGKRGWDDNYARSLAEAKKENKSVLLDFTGSDWCGYCIKIDEEVFSKAAFKNLAKDKLKLVELDFPQNKRLTRAVEQQNEKLQAQYKVNGYPTIILLDSEGREQTRWEGYNPDLVSELKTALEKSKR